ncbi:ras-domain-containing protein, partial [Wilcoxina mikolae CBS 423.85]
YRKQAVMDGRSVIFEILDTAGQEEYAGLRDQWIGESQGFLVCYSISSRSSFIRIPKEQQMEHMAQKTSVLVGMKSDKSTDREVSKEEGEELAKEFGVPFIETSAKTCENVQRAFFTGMRTWRDKNPDQPNFAPCSQHVHNRDRLGKEEKLVWSCNYLYS